MEKLVISGFYWAVGFPELLTLLFIYLRITGSIKWAWKWILSPLWICAISSFAFGIIEGIFK